MADLKLFHEEIMQEEGVKLSELPVEIQKKIKGFNLMRKRLEKNPEDEKLFIQLQKQAIKIGDEVQNFIENDYDDEDEDEKVVAKKPADNKKSENQSKPKSKSDDDDDDDDDDDERANKKPVRKEGGEVDRVAKKPSGKFGNLMMEKKILAIMESRGEKRIKISDLESIIGREPDYPEQEVNNIKLRKVFLSTDYKLL